MSSEAQVILDVWDAVRDHLPHAKRTVVAQELLYAFEEYGFEGADIATIVDEDPDLAAAYEAIYSEDEEEEDSDG